MQTLVTEKYVNFQAGCLVFADGNAVSSDTGLQVSAISCIGPIIVLLNKHTAVSPGFCKPHFGNGSRRSPDDGRQHS